jgi:hypothetical protein
VQALNTIKGIHSGLNDAYVNQNLKNGVKKNGKLMDDTKYAEAYRQFCMSVNGKER